MGRRTIEWVVALGWVGALGCGDGRGSDAGETSVGPLDTTAPTASVTVADESSSSSDAPETASSEADASESSSSDDGPADGFDPSFALAQVDAALAAGVPGLAIAIVYDGELVMAEGFGVADEQGRLVEPSTLFNLASVTKMVTALTVLSERDEGLVTLETPVSSVVPQFELRDGFDPASVEIRHLLTHSAGLGDWPTEPYTAGYTLVEEFAGNPDQPLWFTPGTIFDYSNRGYTLAGLVAAQLHGGSFADAVQARVLAPFGMDGATVDAAVAQNREHARGNSSWDGGWVGPAEYVGEWYQPSGGLWASADDLGALLLVLANQSAEGFDADTIAELGAPVMPTYEYPNAAYGYGVFVDGNEPTVLYHGGSTGGYLADLGVMPARGFGVAIVVNADTWQPGQAGFAILEHYAGPLGYPEGPAAVDPGSLAGAYDDPWQLGHVDVTTTDAGLQASFTDFGKLEALIELWPGFYSCAHPVDGESMDLMFWPDADGQASHLVSRSGVAARTP